MKHYCHCGKVAKFTVVKDGTFLCAAHAEDVQRDCGETITKLGKDDSQEPSNVQR